GRSSAPPEPESYSLDLLADDIYHLVRHLQLDSCYFMGHSMGGMLVQHLAVQYPELVRGLVLIGTTAEPPDPTRFQARRRLIEIAREQGMEAVFAAQLEMGLSQRLQDNPQLIEMWRKEFLLTSREAYIYCASAIARRPSLLAQLAALDVPALIVCGQHDDPFLEPSRRMAEHMPASRLVVMEGCNHAPHVEKPQEFNSLLLEFLSRTALSPSSS
ncbi:MAG TPA: alpha/beta hydrolase, partial [Dehalococcoidia bacterium]|nr:alpha/beta hydrolase [Dehalococcoidia bacterium]